MQEYFLISSYLQYFQVGWSLTTEARKKNWEECARIYFNHEKNIIHDNLLKYDLEAIGP